MTNRWPGHPFQIVTFLMIALIVVLAILSLRIAAKVSAKAGRKAKVAVEGVAVS